MSKITEIAQYLKKKIIDKEINNTICTLNKNVQQRQRTKFDCTCHKYGQSLFKLIIYNIPSF